MGEHSRFGTKYGLSSKKVYGEKTSADDSAMASKHSKLRTTISSYHPGDVWNADEFGLFSAKRLGEACRRKKARHPDTKTTKFVLLLLEKMLLVIIRKTRTPRSFDRKSGMKLRFDYHHNSKAWMNKSLFFGWLKRFDNFIGIQNGKRALLLINNCAAYDHKDDLVSLHHVYVAF